MVSIELIQSLLDSILYLEGLIDFHWLLVFTNLRGDKKNKVYGVFHKAAFIYLKGLTF